MSVQKANVMVPPLRPEPRGVFLTEAVVDAALAVAAWVRAVVAVRREAGRAQRTIARRGRDRAALIALACRYEASQPEFAKDLFAAAKRDPGF